MNMINRSMTKEKLEELLKCSETALCDFKSEIYHICDEESKFSFVKDILSMANTIRDEPAFIVIGVTQKNGHNEFRDVDTSVDENQFLTVIRGFIGPELPEFAYYTFPYNKVRLGIMEIGCSMQGPFYSKKTYGEKVRAKEIYYRLGSSNTVADDCVISEITAWMSTNSDDYYQAIASDLNHYKTEEYNYVLFLGEGYKLSKEQEDCLAMVNWAAIIDMQRGSENDGFYANQSQKIGKRLSIQLIVKDALKIQDYHEGKTLMWFFAGGENAGVPFSDRAWNGNYAKKINKMLEQMIASSCKPYIFCMLFTEDKRSKLLTLIEMQEGVLFDRSVAIEWGAEFTRQMNGNEYDITSTSYSFFRSIREEYINRDYYSDELLLPGKSDLLKLDNLPWIEEVLAPVYINCEKREIESETSFYQGGMLQWSDMNPCIAVIREKCNDLYEKVNAQIYSGTKIEYITLDYQSGAGATTLLRILAWKFHDKSPVVFVDSGLINDIFERLKYIYTKTLNKLVVIIDSPKLDNEAGLSLKQKLSSEGIQAVIIKSCRHLTVVSGKNWLGEELAGKDNRAFFNAYSKQLNGIDLLEEEKKRRRGGLAFLSNSGLFKTPFMYALTTFEGAYAKIEDYVDSHLGEASAEQKQAFLIISLVQYYTGLSVPDFVIKKFYSDLFGNISIQKFITEKHAHLMIFQNGETRFIHQCVAEAMRRRLCAENLTNKEAWKNTLEENLESAIDVLKDHIDNQAIELIIKRLFLQQAENEDNKNKDKHFSDAVEDLNINNSKLRIFQHLLKYYDNPYVYSNISRYYLFIETNFDEALVNINNAIAMKEDYTFYHIKGLIYAKQLQLYLEEDSNIQSIKDEYNLFLDFLLETKKAALEAFEKSIDLEISNTYSYIAEISFCFDILRKFKKKVCPDLTMAQVIKTERFYWCSDVISNIVELTNRMEELVEEYDIEFSVTDYRSQLNALLGNMSEALNGWDSLLSKKDASRSRIRQNIINGYFSINGYKWNGIHPKQQSRVQNLLEDNIVEEKDNARRILQWFNFSRNFEGNLSKAVKYFETQISKKDINFYFYGMIVFYVYGYINNNLQSISLGDQYCIKCEELARNMPHRSKIIEIFDPNHRDITSIQKRDYHSEQQLINAKRISGRIRSIEKSEYGTIIMQDLKLKLKFNPSVNSFYQDRDENKEVSFVVGFGFDGPYALDVKRV